MSEATLETPLASTDTAGWHLRIGWWSLFVFLLMGVLLETLHGFKVGYYLDLSNATRRHMWTLAHAHGALLALVNIGFASTLKLFLPDREAWLPLASMCLFGATILLPGGFFLGGLIIYGGDPGLGVLLTPIGAGLLLVSVLLTVRGLRTS